MTVDDFEFYASNAIWPQLGLPLNQDFLNTVQSDYHGHAQSVNYGNPQEAEDTINVWVADQTRSSGSRTWSAAFHRPPRWC